ncbi:MAG: response regulator transcription factor [Alphaproteobacteria bacterium]|jgi:two-component system KDP operon response regulator KdpE|nr:response regulator transcription factor [Alphaproteobacteria bacterium]
MSAHTLALLIVDDDRQRAEKLCVEMAGHGYVADAAADADQAVAMLAANGADMLVVALPGMAAALLIARIRDWSALPILHVCRRGQRAEKAAALEAGADDFLDLPFTPDDLSLRLKVMLRHHRRQREGVVDDLVRFASGPLAIDFVHRVITVDGTRVQLSRKEYDILRLLARHAGKAVTHQQILAEVWNLNHIDDLQYLRVYVGHLRRKLEREPRRPQLLLAEPGVGYRLAILPAERG